MDATHFHCSKIFDMLSISYQTDRQAEGSGQYTHGHGSHSEGPEQPGGMDQWDSSRIPQGHMQRLVSATEEPPAIIQDGHRLRGEQLC